MAWYWYWQKKFFIIAMSFGICFELMLTFVGISLSYLYITHDGSINSSCEYHFCRACKSYWVRIFAFSTFILIAKYELCVLVNNLDRILHVPHVTNYICIAMYEISNYKSLRTWMRMFFHFEKNLYLIIFVLDLLSI